MTTTSPNGGPANSEQQARLTAAAEETLNRYLATVRRQVLDDLSYRSGGHEDRRFDTNDVRSAITRLEVAERRLSEYSSREVQQARQQRVSRFVRISASVASVAVGAVAAGLTSFVQRYAAAQVLVLSTVLTLFASVAVALLLKQSLRHESRAELRQDREILASAELVTAFARVERLIRELAEQIRPSQSRRTSLLRTLPLLEEAGVWDELDLSMFRQLLRLRNSLVHEDILALTPDEVSLGLSVARRLEDKLALRAQQESERYPRQQRLPFD